MADIDVVPKKRTNLWVWIILAIVVAVILFALIAAFTGDAATRVGEMMNHFLGKLPTSAARS